MSSSDISPVNTVQGQVVQPTHVSKPHSFPAHDFFNVIRDIVHKAGFHSEDDVKSALDAVNAYEQQVVPSGDAKVVTSEDDRAPLEDVTQRRAPTDGRAIPAAPASAPQLDYRELAKAIVAVQAENAKNEETDAHGTD